MHKRILALAMVAGLQSVMGPALAGQSAICTGGVSMQSHLAPPATRRESSTKSAPVSEWGYATGPGWSAAHVQRMAAKRRNRARNKRMCRGKKGGA